MKRFLIRGGLFCCLQLIVVCYVLRNGEPEYRDHFYCSIYDKVDRMDSMKSSRLILVGGSNLAFGIDSRVLESQGYEPINLGLHASLGLEFYMRLIERRIRSGDVIVFVLEYELMEGAVSESVQLDLIDACPEFADYFGPRNSLWSIWKETLDHRALPTAHMWTQRSFRKRGDHRQLLIPEDGPQSVYRRSGFNKFGDVVAHTSMPSQPKDEYAPIQKLDEREIRRSVEMLNAFYRLCRERGASVYFSFPPMPRQRFTDSERGLMQYCQLLYRELDIPQIDRPSDYVFEEEQFFDSFYHLRGDAITTRTERLHASLQAVRIAEHRGHNRLR